MYLNVFMKMKPYNYR